MKRNWLGIDEARYLLTSAHARGIKPTIIVDELRRQRIEVPVLTRSECLKLAVEYPLTYVDMLSMFSGEIE